jgi:hypothetical protein
MKTRIVTTQEEAREMAIDWQDWQATQDLSYDEILKWQEYFESIAEEYNLTDEFSENGII